MASRNFSDATYFFILEGHLRNQPDFEIKCKVEDSDFDFLQCNFGVPDCNEDMQWFVMIYDEMFNKIQYYA